MAQLQVTYSPPHDGQNGGNTPGQLPADPFILTTVIVLGISAFREHGYWTGLPELFLAQIQSLFGPWLNLGVALGPREVARSSHNATTPSSSWVQTGAIAGRFKKSAQELVVA